MAPSDKDLPFEWAMEIETAIKYAGYIERQKNQVAQSEKHDSVRLPADFDYTSLEHLSKEAREKLSRVDRKPWPGRTYWRCQPRRHLCLAGVAEKQAPCREKKTGCGSASTRNGTHALVSLAKLRSCVRDGDASSVRLCNDFRQVPTKMQRSFSWNCRGLRARLASPLRALTAVPHPRNRKRAVNM